MKYTKEAFLKCGKWKKDVLNAVLQDGKEYTVAEVKKLVKPFETEKKG